MVAKVAHFSLCNRDFWLKVTVGLGRPGGLQRIVLKGGVDSESSGIEGGEGC